MIICRWRQEYREGKFVENPSRRISMTKDTPMPMLFCLFKTELVIIG